MVWYEDKVMVPYGKMKITKERKKARKIRAKQARLDGLKQYWYRKKIGSLEDHLSSLGSVPAEAEVEVVDVESRNLKTAELELTAVRPAGKDSPLVCSEAQAQGVDKKGSNMCMGKEGDCEKEKEEEEKEEGSQNEITWQTDSQCRCIQS